MNSLTVLLLPYLLGAGVFIIGLILKITPVWAFISRLFPLIALGILFLVSWLIGIFGGGGFTRDIFLAAIIQAITAVGVALLIQEGFAKFFQRK